MKVLLLIAITGCGFSACNNSPRPPAAPVLAGVPDSAWALLPFKKADSINPVLLPGARAFICPVRGRMVQWESKNVLNPAAVVSGEFLYILYRAQDGIGHSGGTSRIGIAMASSGGLSWGRRNAPVLYPGNDAQKKYEWPGGCEDPRVVEDSSGTYYMTYTAFDGITARLMLATSTNLIKWAKQGPVFREAFQGQYLDKWSKSGSIVSTYKKGKIIATRINGKYWMYWGM